MPHERSRHHSRSRSPKRDSHKRSHRSRSADKRSHHRHHHRHHHHSKHHTPRDERERGRKDAAKLEEPPLPLILPFKAAKLSKRDLRSHRAIFASYLDIQKNKDIFALPEDEVRGRWKSFIGHWNSGELAEGWYDPQTKTKADQHFAEDEAQAREAAQHQPAEEVETPVQEDEDVPDASDNDSDDYGPRALPNSTRTHNSHGPAKPTFADLAERDETRAADAKAARNAHRAEARADAKQYVEDALGPRAEAGTRERQLEKKREVAGAAREFREARGGGDGVAEVGDSEMMGGGGEGIGAIRQREERRKTERELRREEALMARKAEREEMQAGLRAKEEKTMESLRALAKERFGGGG